MIKHVGMLIAILAVTAPMAFADTASDAKTFVDDENRLNAADNAIDSDRSAMANDINNDTALKADVLQFFTDRQKALGLHILAAADRKQLRKDIKFNPGKNGTPGKGTGNLQQDATAFINDFDKLNTAEGNLDNAFQALATAVTSNGNVDTAVNTYFTNLHATHLARLQVVADVFALKKDVKFKGTGAVTKRKATTLKPDVQFFLNDRATWKTDKGLVTTDINNLRAVLTAPTSLESTVNQFLTDKHAAFIAAEQLAIDRFNMRKDVGLKTGSKEPKPGTPPTKNSENNDANDDSLEINLITAGDR